MLPSFVEYYLRTKKVKQFIKSRARGTSGSMQKISNKDINNIEIFLPPLELQQRFANQLDQVNLLREKLSHDNISSLYENLSREIFKNFHI